MAAATALAAELKTKLHINQYSDLIKAYHGWYSGKQEWHCQYPPKGKVYFAVHYAVTPEQAERLVAVLRELGLQKPVKEG